MTEKDLARTILLEEITELLTDYETTYEEWLGVRVWFNPRIDVVWNGKEFTNDFLDWNIDDDKDRKR